MAATATQKSAPQKSKNTAQFLWEAKTKSGETKKGEMEANDIEAVNNPVDDNDDGGFDDGGEGPHFFESIHGAIVLATGMNTFRIDCLSRDPELLKCLHRSQCTAPIQEIQS